MNTLRYAAAFALGLTVATWSPAPGDHAELAALYRADQADRRGSSVDWSRVLPRDRAREARVKELIRTGAPQTGADYYHAAMVLQHAGRPDDYLLAHELCTIALAKGEAQARWLSAATLDRYLMNRNESQRWGTQYRSEGNGPIRLWRVAPGVTDGMRKALDVPPLAEARKREAEFNRKG